MTDTPTIDAVSTDMQCELTEATEAATLRYLAELEAVYEELGPVDDTTTATNDGDRSDDRYNALLHVYDTPRPPTGSGPLDGLVVAVKDNIAARNLRMTCGLEQMEYVPSFDATVVERLLAAGASLVGKANMDAFALGPGGQWSELGTVENPRAADRVPGGSSSGSGAAVAAGLVDVALGSDTGGSIRSPAACCGVVGIRPTQSAVPRYGFVELAPSADAIGPLARDVETAAAALEAIAGADPRDRTTSRLPSGWLAHDGDVEIGVVRSTVDGSVDGVRDVIDEALAAVAADPAVTVTDVDLAFGAVSKAFSICMGAEFGWLVRQSFTVRGQGVQYNPELRAALGDLTFNEHVASRVLPGAVLDEETDGLAYVLARQEVERFERRLVGLFEDVDVLVTPTLRRLPPKFGEVESSEDGLQYSFTKPFSLTGDPSVSVPVGAVDGLPVSAQVVAPEFRDGAAIRAARLLEEHAPGYP